MSALPPGPRSPRLLQSRRWSREPLPFLEQCRARYGNTFTLRLSHLGTWVLLADPEDVKRVFSAGTGDLGVGVPNLALRPVLGAHSVMMSEEPEHMARRKLMLPRFHGERMREDAEVMTVDRSWQVPLVKRLKATQFEVVWQAYSHVVSEPEKAEMTVPPRTRDSTVPPVHSKLITSRIQSRCSGMLVNWPRQKRSPMVLQLLVTPSSLWFT